MNVQYFPFNVQYCVITFGSWEYDATELQLVKQVCVSVPVSITLCGNYHPFSANIGNIRKSLSRLSCAGVCCRLPVFAVDCRSLM